MKLVTVTPADAFERRARLSVEQHWRGEIEVRYVDRDDLRGYERILSELWESGEDFFVVEPDIVIRPDVAEAALTCQCEYGCFPYNWLTDCGPALGCTWFRGSFTTRFPLAMRKVRMMNVTWKQLDVCLMRHVLAREYGQQPHVHLPPVEHLSETKGTLIEGANPEPLMQVPHW